MRYGVVQGRLLPQQGDFIQSFPRGRWLEEFKLASVVACDHIEWIVTQECNEDNPIRTLTLEDMDYIRRKFHVDVSAVCYDVIVSSHCHLHANSDNICKFVDACGRLGIPTIVLPLLEHASICLPYERSAAFEVLDRLVTYATKRGVRFSIESDLDAQEVVELVDRFDVGVTLDTGNLLRLGHNIDEHVDAYCGKVDNVHVKDCVMGGTTVPLGSGGLEKGNLRRTIEMTGVSRVTFQTARPGRGMTDLKQFELNKVWVEMALGADGAYSS